MMKKFPSQDVVDFIHKLKRNGIEVALCSNSPSSRGKNFGKHLPVSKTYPFSCKPFPFCFKKAMKDHGLKASQIAILGDQMYTDILGGNIWGSIYDINGSNCDKGSKYHKGVSFL